MKQIFENEKYFHTNMMSKQVEKPPHLFENESHRFYTNGMTRQLEDHLHRDGDFKHYNVYIAECKVTKAHTYVLYNGNEPVYADIKADGMYAHIDILRTLLHF